MSIKWKIVLSSIVTAFIVVLGMGLVSVKLSQDILEQRAVEFMSGILERNAYEITQQYTAVEKSVSAAFLDVTSTFNVNKARTDSTYLASYLKKIKMNIQLAAELNPSSSAYLLFFDDVGNLDPTHYLYYSDVNFDSKLESPPVPNWLQRGIQDILTKSQDSKRIIFWETLQDPDVLHCYEVYYKDHKPVALIGADLRRDSVKNKLRLAKYLTTGFLYLTDEANNIIYHPEVSDGSSYNTGLSRIQNTDTRTEAVSLENHFEKTIDLNMKSIMRSEITLQSGWHLGMEVQLVDIYNGLDQLRLIIVVSMGLIMLLALTIGIYLGNRIAKPYRHIASQIETIDSNQYNIDLDQSYALRKDEAGVLMRSLLKMIERQKRSFEEIHQNNQNLESLVEDRTQALFKTNEELETALSESEEKQSMLIESNNQLEMSLDMIEKTQQELLKAEKLASLGYLVSGISHQINTPLGNSITSVSYLRRELQNMENKFHEGTLMKHEFSEFLEAIHEGLESVYGNLMKSSTLIDKFKGTAVVSSNEEIVPVHLKSTFNDWIFLLKKQHDAETIDVVLDMEESLIFHCRASSLKRLIDELLINAFEHAFDRIQNPCVSIHAAQLEDGTPGIRLIIMDNGIGVPLDEQQHLFTPFYTTKMGKQHDGLGLNMVYNLVLGVFKGDIVIETHMNQGLQVTLVLYEELL